MLSCLTTELAPVDTTCGDLPILLIIGGFRELESETNWPRTCRRPQTTQSLRVIRWNIAGCCGHVTGAVTFLLTPTDALKSAR